ncbi:MAG: hypothetical protein QOH63_189 [Acidobacteriota bacterium]|jgi:flagellar hook-associated protein FlgK|nr:hypothetical protein [Acidobacteriota bacterium]
MNVKSYMKKRAHGIIVLTLALALSVLAVACSSNSSAGKSPTETLRAYYDAAKKKDVETVKKFLSRGTMQVMEDIAKGQGKTVDEMFKEGANRDAQMPTPEFSNEKITGDTASVDIKVPEQPLVTMQMVKEDGEWKLAIDKMMKGGIKPESK